MSAEDMNKAWVWVHEHDELNARLTCKADSKHLAGLSPLRALGALAGVPHCGPAQLSLSANAAQLQLGRSAPLASPR